ncbi:flagellar basal body-associated FliL family protein [Geobacter argillaceus]|uniref:Flagellar protein FliL n=1 Tax=Geobacter argillaceus TaxID=345631 RepID=A0A562VJE1_9BACT|nr:flagellar basal body-associated FliL family protein [Geobacter argillaceus]TWJ18039.1 flagellar FliL protein [Geobacter argillaceus]
MAEQDAEVKESPKNKKMLFIIGGAVLAVVIAVILVLTMGGGKKDDKAAKPEAAAEAKPAEGGGEAHGGGGEKGKEGAAGAAANIASLEPFIVNIYDGQEIRYLKLKVEFEMANPGVKAELDARQAPLRDAILVLLTTKTLRDIQDLQGKNQLREEILSAVGRILAPGKVTRVYFTDFVVQ